MIMKKANYKKSSHQANPKNQGSDNMLTWLPCLRMAGK
jgi:hypothetical protein